MKAGSKALLLSAIFIFILAAVFVAFSKGLIPKRIIDMANLPQTVSEKPGSEDSPIGEIKEVSGIALTISSPANGDTLSSTNATVKGKTVAGAEVFVNDAEGKADASGNFSINIALEEGENKIVVSANDTSGNVAEKEIAVTVASF